MIVYGWGGGKIRNRGPAVRARCPNCGHDGFFHYFTVTSWFRLFWIPIIPYRTKHFLGCPVCMAGTEISGPEELSRLTSPDRWDSAGSDPTRPA
jgi:hypothetical protein